MPIRIALFGRGRMGKRVAALAQSDAEIALVEQGEPCDVAIDFSSPAALEAHLARSVEAGHSLVIGTTGISSEGMRAIARAAEQIAVMHAPNFSYGMAQMRKSAWALARALKRADVAMNESHHAEKRDAPSGTALMLRETMRDALEDADAPIPIRSERIGDVVGEHAIVFEYGHERIEIKHAAHSRDAFAHGALIAAKWLVGKPPGLYTFEECTT